MPSRVTSGSTGEIRRAGERKKDEKEERIAEQTQIGGETERRRRRGLEITNRLSCVVYTTRIAVNLAGSSGFCLRLRQPGDKPRANPPGPCPRPPRLFPFCPQQQPWRPCWSQLPQTGPVAAPLRPEIRHQGCVTRVETQADPSS